MLSVTDNSRGARGDMERYGAPPPNNEAGCNLFVRPGSSGVVFRFRSNHLRFSATGSLQHSFLSREALATPDLVSVSTNGTSFRCERHVSGQPIAIEYASVQVVRKPARFVMHRELDRSQPHD